MTDHEVAESPIEQRQRELADQIIADLQERELAKPPEVWYELRSDEDHERNQIGQLRLETWDKAVDFADTLSGQLCTSFDIYRVTQRHVLFGERPAPQAAYVATYCGGSPYWMKPGSHDMHQVGSAGFCWTCLQPDTDLGQVQHGLMRHPVTPAEVESGAPDYQCFVCSARLGEDHLPIPHRVIWGEECHPRCEGCGLGYQIATPKGIGYEPHADDCPEMAELDERTEALAEYRTKHETKENEQ